jgi:hypothetical protein
MAIRIRDSVSKGRPITPLFGWTHISVQNTATSDYGNSGNMLGHDDHIAILNYI